MDRKGGKKMIIRAWRTKECLAIDEYETDNIDIQFEDPEEAREAIIKEWEPMLNFTTDGGYTWRCIPMQFVIGITEG